MRDDSLGPQTGKMRTFEEFFGRELIRATTSWDENRVMLYALGVGAGLDDNQRELQFTTENTPGSPLRVLPTFIAQLQRGFGWTELFGWGSDPGAIRAVHGEHAVTLAALLPTAGSVETVTVLDQVYDKGSGALVVTSTHLTDLATGTYLGSSRMSVFVQGKGGYGIKGPVPGQAAVTVPEREPDAVVRFPVGLNQSLIFRHMGDHTLHGSTMEGARRDGFERPILFGLATFGYAGRSMLRALCEDDVARFGHMEGRFSKPVFPGDQLDIRIWRQDEGARFQVIAGGERVAFDRGLFRFAGA